MKKRSVCVGGIFSFFLPQFFSTNLWLSVVRVLRVMLWTVTIYLAFIFQCFFFFSPRHKEDVVLLQTLSKNVIKPYGWRREPWSSHRFSSNLKKTPSKQAPWVFWAACTTSFPHLDTESFSSCTHQVTFAGHLIYFYAICSSYREPLL